MKKKTGFRERISIFPFHVSAVPIEGAQYFVNISRAFDILTIPGCSKSIDLVQ